MIVISSGTSVSVSPIDTLDDLTVATTKFATLVKADPAVTMCKLATAVGDLSASVVNGDTNIGFAEEVADVLIAAMVAAANHGLTGLAIREALAERLKVQTSQNVGEAIQEMLADRGMSRVA